MPWESQYIHAWPSQWQKDGGTYLVPKNEHRGIKYQTSQLITRACYDNLWEIPDDIDTTEFDFTWHPDPTDPPFIYQFGTQHQKTGGPRYVTEGASEVKFVGSPKVIKKTIDNCWTIPDDIDTTEFDFTWHPDKTEPPYIYQFGTQHQKTGGPRYVMEGASEVKFVRFIKANITPKSGKIIYLIDHYDNNLDKTVDSISNKEARIKTTRYASNYLNTLRRIAKRAQGEHDFIWVCSSLCDYTDFDFSWHPEQWQSNMIHVFPSNEQKFGDTFFIPVDDFLLQDNIELLEWHQINFITDISVPRWPMPVIQHEYDSHIDFVLQNSFSFPLNVITNKNDKINELPTVPLWDEKTKTIVSLNKGSSTCVFPREATSYISSQIYDYPYIESAPGFATDTLQDIVFISYDEPSAEKNWHFLKSLYPRAKRVHGVSGMENALLAAAEKSSTPWYYAVFAKTELNPEFDFSYIPDYFQVPKNYIFDCRNDLNDLEYGHMGIVLYNCNLIKNALGYENLDLDYTLSFPHESVPILSCFGKFNSTPYHTWRTAFREVSKLVYFQHNTPSIDNEYRIETWTNYAKGDYSEWCIQGARDGMLFAKNVNYNLDELKNGFRWEWLQNYFETLYGSIDEI